MFREPGQWHTHTLSLSVSVSLSLTLSFSLSRSLSFSLSVILSISLSLLLLSLYSLFPPPSVHGNFKALALPQENITCGQRFEVSRGMPASGGQSCGVAEYRALPRSRCPLPPGPLVHTLAEWLAQQGGQERLQVACGAEAGNRRSGFGRSRSERLQRPMQLSVPSTITFRWGH